MANRMSQAMALALEYRTLVRDGNIDRAEQVHKSIDDCGVGSYVDGKWTLDEPIRREMGLVQSRSRAPAGEGWRLDRRADRIDREAQRRVRARPQNDGRVCRTADSRWAVRCPLPRPEDG